MQIPLQLGRIRRAVSHLLNIGPEEWEKVGFAWGMKFFLAFGHILGHTAFVAVFAARVGVEFLPLFFFGNALLAIISTFLIVPFIERVKKEHLVIALAAVSAALLLAAPLVLEGRFGMGLSILFLVFGGAITQIDILLALFIEDQYTPFESQRTFPIIESAEMFGMLAGGFAVTVLVSLFHLRVTSLFVVWGLALLFLVAVLWMYIARARTVPELSLKHEEREEGFFNDIREGVKHLRTLPFVKVLAGVMLVNAVVFKVIEYQYTKTIAEMDLHHGDAAAHGTGEEAFVHTLGLYAIGFATAAIVLQLFFSSRILRKLGTVPSLMVNPLLTLAALIPMILRLSPATAIGARLTSDLTRVVYKDAYLSSFYALSRHVRERIKAFIEGWIVPVGALLGTSILALEEFMSHAMFDNVTRGVLIAGTLLATLLLLYLRNHYTNLSVVALSTGDEIERHTAIEILGDQGHVNAVRHLLRRLTMPTEKPHMKQKILETLGRLGDETTLPAILDAFAEKNVSTQIAAVESLEKFGFLGRSFFSQAFTKYRLEHTLKHAFATESSPRLKLAIMRVFANMQAREIIPFLLKILKEGDVEVQAECIEVIGQFHDPNIVHYLRPYLTHEDPRLRSNAIIALWQFPNERLNLLVQVVGLLGKKDRDSLISTLYLLGEIKSTQEKRTIEKHLGHDDPVVRRHATVALLKLEDRRAVEHLLPIILGADPVESWKARQMLRRADSSMRKLVERRIHQEVTARVNHIVAKAGHDLLRLSRIDLMELIRLYSIAGARQEVVKLQAILEKKPLHAHDAAEKAPLEAHPPVASAV